MLKRTRPGFILPAITDKSQEELKDERPWILNVPLNGSLKYDGRAAGRWRTRGGRLMSVSQNWNATLDTEHTEEPFRQQGLENLTAADLNTFLSVMLRHAKLWFIHIDFYKMIQVKTQQNVFKKCCFFKIIKQILIKRFYVHIFLNKYFLTLNIVSCWNRLHYH